MKPRNIKDQFGDTVTVERVDGVVLVVTKQAHGTAARTTLLFTRKQSRKLRKALKATEQAT